MQESNSRNDNAYLKKATIISWNKTSKKIILPCIKFHLFNIQGYYLDPADVLFFFYSFF